ncbi:hypothetical protein RI054_26g109060 [Pseudoscourfieldia marina]
MTRRYAGCLDAVERWLLTASPFVYPYGRGRHGDFDELSADEERTMLPQWTAVIVLRVSAGGNSAIIPIVFGGGNWPRAFLPQLQVLTYKQVVLLAEQLNLLASSGWSAPPGAAMKLWTQSYGDLARNSDARVLDVDARCGDKSTGCHAQAAAGEGARPPARRKEGKNPTLLTPD